MQLFTGPYAFSDQLSFRPFLYLTSEHLGTQGHGPIFSFVLYLENIQAACALFHCTQLESGHWSSPVRAPFGGVQADKNCRPEHLDFLIQCIKRYLIQSGAKFLSVKTAPACYYGPGEYLLHDEIYRKTGFSIASEFRNHSVTIDDDGFSSHIAASENRRLRKAMDAGFKGGMDAELTTVFIYQFLLDFRTLKGYSLSLSYEQIEELMVKFPKEIKVFTVKDQEKVIALAFTVLVRNNIVYNFLSADIPEYRRHSPHVMLTETIYNYCREEGINTLDLGISSDHSGAHKPSLARFKQNIGGKESSKKTYELVF